MFRVLASGSSYVDPRVAGGMLKRCYEATNEAAAGSPKVADIPARGRDEIATLADAFNRMRRAKTKQPNPNPEDPAPAPWYKEKET